MSSITRRTTRRGRSRGAATVELAIIGPAVILLMLAGIDLVRLYVARNTAQTVAYESAKFGLTPGTTEEDIIEEARSRLSIFCAKRADVEVESEAVGPAADSVTVHIKIPIQSNSWLLGTTNGSINADCTVHSNRGRMTTLQTAIDVEPSSGSTDH